MNRVTASLFSCLFLLAACQGEPVDPGKSNMKGQDTPEVPRSFCGAKSTGEIATADKVKKGRYEIQNDEDNVWLLLYLEEGISNASADFYIGSRAAVPMDAEGDPLIEDFPIKSEFDGSQSVWMLRIPVSELSECNHFMLHLTCTMINGQKVAAWAFGSRSETIIPYCLQRCEAGARNCDSGTEPGEFTTFMQEHWEEPSGEQRGFSDAIFRRAFPHGLQMGCNHKITLTNFQSVKNFLPSHGESKAIASDETDPQAGAVKNDLAGEICSLTLAVELDEVYDPFSKSNGSLKTLLITTGPFVSWTVADVLAEANAVFGGCDSQYTPADMLAIVALINREFENGKLSTGFLRCPPNQP